jgi:hypothetical protein
VRSRERTTGARRRIEGKRTTPSLSIKSEFARTTDPRNLGGLRFTTTIGHQPPDFPFADYVPRGLPNPLIS